jgi:hypothetical protein
VPISEKAGLCIVQEANELRTIDRVGRIIVEEVSDKVEEVSEVHRVAS